MYLTGARLTEVIRLTESVTQDPICGVKECNAILIKLNVGFGKGVG
jgi:hypothetical protein